MSVLPSKFKNGKLKCQICKKLYNHLGSHIWHGHKTLSRDYKEEFGLPYNIALINQDIHDKKSIHFQENKEKYLPALLQSHKKYGFKKGHKLNAHKRVSPYEKQKEIERILKVNKSHKKLSPCPVCNIKYNHVESHLFNKHRLLKA